MSIRKLGDIITLDFTTHNPSTGAVSDGDTLPICEVFKDVTDTPIVTPTVVKRSGKLGDYRVSLDTSSGFELNKSYNVVVTATVNSITAKSRIGAFVLDSKRIADLNDLSQTQILSDGIPFDGALVDVAVSSRASEDNATINKNALISLLKKVKTLVGLAWLK